MRFCIRFSHEIVGDFLGHCTGHGVTAIGIQKPASGLGDGWLTQHSRNVGRTLLARRSGQLIHFFEILALRPTRVSEAGAVREQLFDCDFGIGRIHVDGKFGEDLFDRGAPRELPFFHERRQHGGGHSFSVGAEVKLVVDGDWRVGAVLAHADRAHSGESLAGYDRARKRRQVVALANGFEK